MQAIQHYGLTLFFLGVGVTIVPQIVAFFFSYYVLHIKNPIDALACVAGGRSANPLSRAAGQSRQRDAGRPFTVTYAVANVFLTLWGPVIVGIITKNAAPYTFPPKDDHVIDRLPRSRETQPVRTQGPPDRDRLVRRAAPDAQRRPRQSEFLATLPRRAFLSLGDFALYEAERSYSYLDIGLGGLPEHEGIAPRFETYASDHRADPGVVFLRAALSYAKDQLGIDVRRCLRDGRRLPRLHVSDAAADAAADRTARQRVSVPGNVRPAAHAGPFSTFATEGGTAAMAYIFQSLSANKLIAPGDKIALATPIFSPYLEIPVLPEYGLEVVDIRMDRTDDWQLPEGELAKLLDPAIKIFCMVNPSNPPSTKHSDAVSTGWRRW